MWFVKLHVVVVARTIGVLLVGYPDLPIIYYYAIRPDVAGAEITMYIVLILKMLIYLSFAEQLGR